MILVLAFCAVRSKARLSRSQILLSANLETKYVLLSRESANLYCTPETIEFLTALFISCIQTALSMDVASELQVKSTEPESVLHIAYIVTTLFVVWSIPKLSPGSYIPLSHASATTGFPTVAASHQPRNVCPVLVGVASLSAIVASAVLPDWLVGIPSTASVVFLS